MPLLSFFNNTLLQPHILLLLIRWCPVQARNLKPRPNDRNMPTQHDIARLLGATCCVRQFGHRVVMCCDMLCVVDSNWKMIKFEPATPNTSQHGRQTHSTWCAQQCCVLPALCCVGMLRSFGLN